MEEEVENSDTEPVYDRHNGEPSVRNLLTPVDRKINRKVNEMVDIIDRVHLSTIVMPGIPVYYVQDEDNRGILVLDTATGEMQRIEISNQQENPEITILHEIGHLIDYAAAGEPRQFESLREDGLFTRLLVEAKKTPEIIAMQAALATGMAPYKGKDRKLPLGAIKTLKYWLKPNEIVARTYAQYISSKSKSETLLTLIEERRESGIFDEQWDAANFHGILLEWDNLLNEIGWQTLK